MCALLWVAVCRYKANLDLAQPAVFGKGAGCELVKESCDAYVKQNPQQNYYCRADRKDGERDWGGMVGGQG
jgi:hypothetical protein